MRKYLLLGIALICHAAPAQAAENSSKRYTIEQLMASDTIGGLSWSPDDTKLIFTSNRTGIANIYEMPSDGGTPTPLTNSVKLDGRVQFGPNSDRWTIELIGRNLTDQKTNGAALRSPSSLTVVTRTLTWMAH